MKTLGAYVRVSTEEQAKEGFSIEAQTRVLQAYAIVKGYEKVEMYVDEGYSGKNLRRPQVQRLIADCKAERLQGVIVWRYDRLSRSLRDTLMLVDDVFQAHNVEFISTSEQIDTSSPSGRLVLNILASCAQNEREVTEQRVRMVCLELAKKCVHLGGVAPFGFQIINQRYAVEPHEAEAVRHIYQMYVDGLGYSAIMDYLSENGYTTRTGKPFRKTTLYEILGNEKYAGVYVYNRTVASTRNGKRNNHASKPDDEVIRVEDGIPAIIDKATWERACQMRLNNKHRRGAYTAKQVYLLSGIAVCGVCGRKVSGSTYGHDRKGTPQRYYACHDNCVRRARKEKIESFVIRFLQMLADDPTIVHQTIGSVNRLIDQDAFAFNDETKSIANELRKVRDQIQNINSFIAEKGADAPSSLLESLYALERKKATLSGALDSANTRYRHISEAEVIDMLSEFHNIQNRPMEVQKTAIHRAVESVALYSDHFDMTLYNSVCGGGEGS